MATFRGYITITFWETEQGTFTVKCDLLPRVITAKTPLSALIKTANALKRIKKEELLKHLAGEK